MERITDHDAMRVEVVGATANAPPPPPLSLDVHHSPWPLVVALAAVLLFLGLVALPLGLLGLLLLGVGALGWMAEEYRTVLHAKPTSGKVRTVRQTALQFFLVTETILFGVLFTYYFWARSYAAGPWPPQGTHALDDLRMPAFNTALLVLSGVSAHLSLHWLRAGRAHAAMRALAVTIVLGLAFLVGQLREYLSLGFSFADHGFGSAFYALTGVHGVHVAGGLVLLSVLLLLGMQGGLSARRWSGLWSGVIYWHFVDGVWLVLFAVLYLRIV